MILPFSTHINGEPTYFVQKIWAGLIKFPIATLSEERIYIEEARKKGLFNLGTVRHPKLHTIRADKNDRWHSGTQIHFYINNRQPNMFQFAPVVPCVSVQEIEIKWQGNHVVPIIDGKPLTPEETVRLSRNDGFDNVEDFFAYFNTDFKGKIIHWTDLNY